VQQRKTGAAMESTFIARCRIMPKSLPIEWSIAGFLNSATLPA